MHNSRLPHSAFREQTPDEMYLETGRGSDRLCVFGFTPGGRYIAVIYEEDNDDTVIPIGDQD